MRRGMRWGRREEKMVESRWDGCSGDSRVLSKSMHMSGHPSHVTQGIGANGQLKDFAGRPKPNVNTKANKQRHTCTSCAALALCACSWKSLIPWQFCPCKPIQLSGTCEGTGLMRGSMDRCATLRTALHRISLVSHGGKKPNVPRICDGSEGSLLWKIQMSDSTPESEGPNKDRAAVLLGLPLHKKWLKEHLKRWCLWVNLESSFSPRSINTHSLAMRTLSVQSVKGGQRDTMDWVDLVKPASGNLKLMVSSEVHQ